MLPTRDIIPSQLLRCYIYFYSDADNSLKDRNLLKNISVREILGVAGLALGRIAGI